MIIIASPSMAIGLVISFNYFRYDIFKANKRLNRIKVLIKVLMLSHVIAGFICGIIVIYPSVIQFDFVFIFGSILSTMLYSLMISPLTTIIITVGIIMFRKNESLGVANV